MLILLFILIFFSIIFMYIPIPTTMDGIDLEPAYMVVGERTSLEYDELIALDQVRFDGDFNKADPYETLELFMSCSVRFKEDNERDEDGHITKRGDKYTVTISDYNDYKQLMKKLKEDISANNILDALDDLPKINGNYYKGYKATVSINFLSLSHVMNKLNFSEDQKNQVALILEINTFGGKLYTLPDFIINGESGRFLFPTPTLGTITSPYGSRIHPVTGKLTFHYGTDISGEGALGEPIISIYDGVVTKVEYDSLAGNYVVINHNVDNNTITTKYLHMNQVQSNIVVGAEVKRGQVIGAVGNTGRSTGAHLHFGVQINGEYIDPLSIYN